MVDYIFQPPTNGTTELVSMLQYIDSLTNINGQGGIIGLVMIVVITGVLFMMMKGFGTEKAAGTSFIVSSILAFFLKMMNLINNQILVICVILAIGGIYLLINDAAKYES